MHCSTQQINMHNGKVMQCACKRFCKKSKQSKAAEANELATVLNAQLDNFMPANELTVIT